MMTFPYINNLLLKCWQLVPKITSASENLDSYRKAQYTMSCITEGASHKLGRAANSV